MSRDARTGNGGGQTLVARPYPRTDRQGRAGQRMGIHIANPQPEEGVPITISLDFRIGGNQR